MRQATAGVTISEGSSRELHLGEDWVMPVMVFFSCEEEGEVVIWEDQIKDGSHLIVRGPKVVHQGHLDGMSSIWKRCKSKWLFWKNKF